MNRVDRERLATLDAAELARTLAVSADSFAELARTVAQNARSTIEPPTMRADSIGRRAIADLEVAIAGGLALEETLGEGGMGLVRLATQRSLGRRVAVKTLRTEVRTDEAKLRLLR